MNWRHSGQAQALQILGLTSLRGESSHRAANRLTFHLGHNGPWPDYCHGLRNGKASLSSFPPDHLSWLPWPSGTHKGILFFFFFFPWPHSGHEQLCAFLWPCARDLMKEFQGDKWRLHGNQSRAAGVLCRQLFNFISFSFFSPFPGINSFKSLTSARVVWLSGKLKLAAGTFCVFLQNWEIVQGNQLGHKSSGTLRAWASLKTFFFF